MHRLVIAVVTLLGLAAGAVVAGYLLLGSGTADPAAEMAPANTTAYVRVYLQPSAGQRVKLAHLVTRLPGFADAATLDQKIDQVMTNLLRGRGVDYVADIKPWVGDQLAVAAWPSDGTETIAVMIAAVKDRAAADRALPGLFGPDAGTFTIESHGGTDIHVADGVAYAFVDGALIIGPSSDALGAVVDAAAGSPSLADQPAFRSAMAAIEPDHLAAIYVDLRASLEANRVESAFGGATTLSAALVAEPDGLRLSGVMPVDVDRATPSARDRLALGGEPSSLGDWMPAGTLASAVTFGLAQTLSDLEATLEATDPSGDALGLLDTIRALAAFGLGIDIDADLLPLFDREAGVAITGNDTAGLRGLLLGRPDDIGSAATSIERIAGQLVRSGARRSVVQIDGIDVTTLAIPDGPTLAYAVVDQIVLIGSSATEIEAALNAHRSGATLAASDAYRRTFDLAGTRGGSEIFIDLGASLAGGSLDGVTAELPAEVRDILAHLGTVGFTAPSRGDSIEFHAVVTVDDGAAE